MNRLKFYCLLFTLNITGVIFCFTVTAQKNYTDTTKYLSVPGSANRDTTLLPDPSPKRGYEHMHFSFPSSTNNSSFSQSDGFMFSYYNKMASPTFSELDGVYGGKIKIADKEDFEKFVNNQLNNLKKGFKKSETLQEITQDSLTSNADYISSLYFVTEDTKPAVRVNGNRPVLELRQYSSLIYKKDLTSGEGNFYSIYFSERGLPQELHTKEEIHFKIQQLLSSCEFGDFK